jgi:hypothetical protein
MAKAIEAGVKVSKQPPYRAHTEMKVVEPALGLPAAG